MFAMLTSIGPSIMKILNIFGTLNRINELAREWAEAIAALKKILRMLKTDGKTALKELDEALEKTADICGQVPGLKKAEQTFRDMISREDYE